MKSYDYFYILHTRKLWLTIVHHLPKVNPGLYDFNVPNSSRISPATSHEQLGHSQQPSGLSIIVLPILDKEIGPER